MKKNCIINFRIAIVIQLVVMSYSSQAQTSGWDGSNILEKLPTGLTLKSDTEVKYRLTTFYFNQNIFGEFQDKLRVCGEFSRDLKANRTKWSNVTIAFSNKQDEEFSGGKKLDYMENMEYKPSPDMLKESAFNKFPDNFENVYARNLVWDLMAIEDFAWNYLDSLRLNTPYKLPNHSEKFSMAEVGNYKHSNIYLTYQGVSKIKGDICAIIQYRALDNKLELNTKGLKSKGIELYWGDIWVSLNNKIIRYATMFSSTTQELEIQGMPNKFTLNTRRDLVLEETE